VANETPKPLGTHATARRSHWQMRGAKLALALREGRGLETFDEATLRAYAFTNAPAWEIGPYGPHLTFTSAGTNRIDLGDVAALDGATYFTLAMLCRRTTASDAVWLQKGSSTNTRVQVGYGNDNQAYFIVANGANSRGHATNNNTSWHMLTLVYDGTQATDALRLRGYIDGVEQGLTYDAATPTTSPSSAASLYVGYNQSAPLYSNGSVAGVWLWDRALEPRDVAAHARDPWAALRVRRTYPRLARVASLAPAVYTVTWSSEDPVDGATEAEVTHAASIIADPTGGPANPLDTWAATVDGVSATVTVEGAGGNAERGTVEFFFEFGRTYQIVWTVVTADANPNTYTHDFTVRGAVDWEVGAELADTIVPSTPVSTGSVSLIAAPGSYPYTEMVELIAHGGANTFVDLVELRIVEALGVGYHSPERVSLIAASRYDNPYALPMRHAVGPGYRTYLAMRHQLEGRTDTTLPARIDSINARFYVEVAFAEEVGDPKETVLAGAFDAGPRADTTLAMREDADGVAFAPIQGTAVSRNEARVEAEED
jgi:hypothetical protein